MSLRYNLTATTAALSSNLGKVMLRIGASLDFDVTNDVSNVPVFVTKRRYATAPYATSDASPKIWSSTSEGSWT